MTGCEHRRQGLLLRWQMLRQVVVRPELAEHLMTTGDIGVPISALCKRFPLVRLVVCIIVNGFS